MENTSNSLLPSGFFDLLPPDARQQRLLYQQVLDSFAIFGYLEVAPPLMEFEASLLNEKTASLASHTFRLMDPLSREMMGLRTDMTMQIARIATARLSDQPRPLRLCYAGTCLRVAGDGLRRERQFMQAGIELIGSDLLAADIEVIRVAISSLNPLGLGEVTIDITLPELSAALLAELPDSLRPACQQAILQKDRSSLNGIVHPLIPVLANLMDITGCEDPSSIDWLSLLSCLPPLPRQLLEAWVSRITIIKAANLPARLTFDPLEQQGFEYHTGLAFSIFASRVESEIGRGGRYLLQDNTPATGFTIYLNPLRYVMPPPPALHQCYIPFGTDGTVSESLRSEGWATLHALEPENNPLEQARLHHCTHIWENGNTYTIQKDI